jgi:hypothetical protein
MRTIRPAYLKLLGFITLTFDEAPHILEPGVFASEIQIFSLSLSFKPLLIRDPSSAWDQVWHPYKISKIITLYNLIFKLLDRKEKTEDLELKLSNST